MVFKDASGNYAGIETEMALQIAEWAFGSRDKAELTCVTAENRIPQLTGKKVDILYATLGVTPERARVVAFSDAYRWDGSDVVVLKDSPVKHIADLKGKTVIALKGSNQARWFEEKQPDTESMRLNSTADALQALKQNGPTARPLILPCWSASPKMTAACVVSMSHSCWWMPPPACARVKPNGWPTSMPPRHA